MPERQSLRPLPGANRALRQRLTLRGEFALAFLPTVTVLGMLGLVEVLSQQRLLFTSLASSAFLIDLGPQHGTNAVRTRVVSQMPAATIGLGLYAAWGPGYGAAGSAMVLTIALMAQLCPARRGGE